MSTSTTVVTKEQMDDLRKKLKFYNHNWAQMLSDRIQKELPDEASKFSRTRIYGFFYGTLTNPKCQAIIYNQGHSWLLELRDEIKRLTDSVKEQKKQHKSASELSSL